MCTSDVKKGEEECKVDVALGGGYVFVGWLLVMMSMFELNALE